MDSRRKLSENFTLAEFLRSSRAERMGIHNFPTEAQIQRGVVLANTILEPWRKAIGCPIRINDNGGFRCRKLNNATPGSSLTSQHMSLEAADVNTDIPLAEAFEILKGLGLPIHQAIFERNARGSCWIHVSCAPEGVEPAGRFLMHDPSRGIRGYEPWDGRDLCL